MVTGAGVKQVKTLQSPYTIIIRSFKLCQVGLPIWKHSLGMRFVPLGQSSAFLAQMSGSKYKSEVNNVASNMLNGL